MRMYRWWINPYKSSALDSTIETSGTRCTSSSSVGARATETHQHAGWLYVDGAKLFRRTCFDVEDHLHCFFVERDELQQAGQVEVVLDKVLPARREG